MGLALLYAQPARQPVSEGPSWPTGPQPPLWPAPAPAPSPGWPPAPGPGPGQTPTPPPPGSPQPGPLGPPGGPYPPSGYPPTAYPPTAYPPSGYPPTAYPPGEVPHGPAPGPFGTSGLGFPGPGPAPTPTSKRPHPLQLAGLGALALLLIGAALFFALRSGGSSNGSTTPPSDAGKPAGATRALRFEVAGSSGHEQVTLERVIDPAQLTTGQAPLASGLRLVALELTVADTSGGPLLDDLSMDVRARTSAGAWLSPITASVKGCNDIEGGMYQLTAGLSATRCAVVEVPPGSHLTRVAFSPLGGATGSPAVDWALKG